MTVAGQRAKLAIQSDETRVSGAAEVQVLGQKAFQPTPVRAHSRGHVVHRSSLATGCQKSLRHPQTSSQPKVHTCRDRVRIPNCPSSSPAPKSRASVICGETPHALEINRHESRIANEASQPQLAAAGLAYTLTLYRTLTRADLIAAA
jgi:hypothetical protein